MKAKKEIEIILNEDSNIYNQYNNEQLSNELHEYIYNQFKGVPVNTDIKMIIKYNFELDDTEKDKLVDKIREDFGIDVKENLINLKIERIKQLFFLCIGTILIFISNKFDNASIKEIMSIFGWIWLWEFGYSFCFDTIKTKIQNRRYKKLIKAKIEFKKNI